MRARFAIATCAWLVTAPALAQSLVPGPGEAGYDAALAAKADAYDLQVHTFMTPTIGWGLEAYVDEAGDRAAIEAFFASGERDFQAQSGMHPFEALTRLDEHGDLGMFGGVQAAGDAFRYAVLRDSGAPAPEVDRARDLLLRAMDGLHWYTQVTGTPGIVARGIMRITPEAGDPALPGTIPATLPLFDASGAPQPADKSPTWRDDQSGELPFLIWIDDCSKDQMDGYIYALGAVYDVVHADATIPSDRVDRLVADALAIGRKLMERVTLPSGAMVDLAIKDADGRLTSFHDMSAEEIAPGVVLGGMPPINGFNGWMGLGVMRTLYHITGDEQIGRFYYEELLGRRDYMSNIEETVHLMYLGEQTNYSNVNMAFVAAWGVLRYESDDAIWARARAILHDNLYAPGEDRDAEGLGQSLFDFLYAAFQSGPAARGMDAVNEGTATLREFPAPPYWDPFVENCDAAELAALSCTAIDGTTTIALSDMRGRGDGIVAVEPLPKRLRPPSNFEWRSDPHSVNGGGGTRLNPGGDFHGAYWMGRLLRASGDNRAPDLRLAFAVPPTPDGGVGPRDGGAGADGAVAADGGGGPGDGGGCGCVAAGVRNGGAGWLAVLAGIAVWGARRRKWRVENRPRDPLP